VAKTASFAMGASDRLGARIARQHHFSASRYVTATGDDN
jgi:hypothetical protein